MNGARRLFKMLEDFAGNLATGFGISPDNQRELTTTTTTTMPTTLPITVTTTQSSSTNSAMTLDLYQQLLDKYYMTSSTSSTTTEKPKTMLERVKEHGALSTWNMNKKDKWKLLTQLSKSYLEKRLGRSTRDLSIPWDTWLQDVVSPADGSQDRDPSVSEQSNIIPTFGMPETLVRNPYYDKFLPLKSKTQIRKKRGKGGGFSIFSLLNFMLVVLNIIIDINNNINNNK